jgi:hypothetical protein
MEVKLLTKLNNYDYKEFFPYNKHLTSRAIIHFYLISTQTDK